MHLDVVTDVCVALMSNKLINGLIVVSSEKKRTNKAKQRTDAYTFSAHYQP